MHTVCVHYALLFVDILLCTIGLTPSEFCFLYHSFVRSFVRSFIHSSDVFFLFVVLDSSELHVADINLLRFIALQLYGGYLCVNKFVVF